MRGGRYAASQDICPVQSIRLFNKLKRLGGTHKSKS